MVAIAAQGNNLSFDTSFPLNGPLSTPLTGDATPVAVDWTTMNYDGNVWEAQSEQFTGITRTISVEVYPTLRSKTSCYFKVGTSDLTGSYAIASTPAANGYTLLTEQVTQSISIAPNQWLTFAAFVNVGFPNQQTCTVTNATTGGTFLDTFTLTTNLAPP